MNSLIAKNFCQNISKKFTNKKEDVVSGNFFIIYEHERPITVFQFLKTEV